MSASPLPPSSPPPVKTEAAPAPPTADDCSSQAAAAVAALDTNNSSRLLQIDPALVAASQALENLAPGQSAAHIAGPAVLDLLGHVEPEGGHHPSEAEGGHPPPAFADDGSAAAGVPNLPSVSGTHLHDDDVDHGAHPLDDDGSHHHHGLHGDPSLHAGGDGHGSPPPADGSAPGPSSSSAIPLLRQKKANQRGGPGGGSVNETGQRKPTSQLRNEGRPPKGVTECASCGLKESPEWRKGESGLKDLCNACGLRHARLVAKRAGKIRPRKKKTKAGADGSADTAESSKRGGKRARTGAGGADQMAPALTVPAGGAHGLDPALAYAHYGHHAPHPGYYAHGADGLQPGMQQQQQQQQHLAQQASPHQLPPIDAAAYGAGAPTGASGGPGQFYNPAMHAQLQQARMPPASSSPTSYGSSGGPSTTTGGPVPPQLPPIGGPVPAGMYAPYPTGPYYAHPQMQQHPQQQMHLQQQQHAALGGYAYYPQQHMAGPPGTYDPQLQQQQQQQQQSGQQQSSQPHTPQQPNAVPQQQQRPAQQQGFYAAPSFPNYGYQMQPGHFPDGYASAQAAAASGSGGAAAGAGGAGAGGASAAAGPSPSQPQQQQPQAQQPQQAPAQQQQESEERGGPAGAAAAPGGGGGIPSRADAQPARAQEGTA